MSGAFWLILGAAVAVILVVGVLATVSDRQSALEHAQKRTGFTASKRYDAENGFLAADMDRKLLLISETRNGRISSKVYPWKNIIESQVTIKTHFGAKRSFIDVTMDDIVRPNWQLRFPYNHHSARQTASLLDVIRKRAVA